MLNNEKKRQRSKEKVEGTRRLHQLFKEIWDEREDESGFCYCFETGRAMHGSTFRGNSCCYHHVLEKNAKAYPQYAETRENIVILYPEVHTSVTGDIDKCPKVKSERERLLRKHEEGLL